MTSSASASPQFADDAARIEPLTLLSRIAQAAVPPDPMPSLSFQLASAVSQLGSFLHVRGEENIEHYYGTALTLACFEPVDNDIRPYQAILHTFLNFDRRSPALPALVPAAQLRLQKSSSIHFIQQLRDQKSFQAIYAAARQVDTYGTWTRSRKKCDRIILLARELGGRSLVAPMSAEEELVVRLGA